MIHCVVVVRRQHPTNNDWRRYLPIGSERHHGKLSICQRSLWLIFVSNGMLTAAAGPITQIASISQPTWGNEQRCLIPTAFSPMMTTVDRYRSIVAKKANCTHTTLINQYLEGFVGAYPLNTKSQFPKKNTELKLIPWATEQPTSRPLLLLWEKWISIRHEIFTPSMGFMVHGCCIMLCMRLSRSSQQRWMFSPADNDGGAPA